MKERVTYIQNDNSVIIQSETVWKDEDVWTFAHAVGMGDVMHEVKGHYHPWTWRYTDDNGNLLIIAKERTLD